MSRLRILRRAAVIASVIAVTVGGTVVGTPAAQADDDCSVRWGSNDKTSAPESERQVIGVRAGRHRCYDRVVIDLNGAAATTTGYYVHYVSDDPRAPGAASLIISVNAPTFDGSGNPTYRPRDPYHLVNVSGFSTLRQVALTGAGLRTDFFLGVRARLPMRAFRLDGPGNRQRVVIDVAHHR